MSIAIGAEPGRVYDFVVKTENLPRWAGVFCKSINHRDGRWVAETPAGPATIAFIERNDLGVLDHTVTFESGMRVTVPMRVVANGDGCEVLFTLFKPPDMSDDKFTEDLQWVMSDLKTLKAVIEAGQ